MDPEHVRPCTAAPLSRRRAGCVALLGGLLVLTTGGFATACDVVALTHLEARLSCPVPEHDASWRPRLEVRLDGFHDDSQVSMTVEAGGEAAGCAQGDRTTLSGEDGDEGQVTLYCHVDPAAIRRGVDRVSVRVELHHAQFEGAGWVAGPPADQR